ncbi:probable anion transporter 1, chloroplastic isoform X2 [Quercus robur]|uniref:probable anion transporter 1, chloroplastic isoform X2 n=1 Tax=Quercus robur TaxID=38942 RepID=UPI0021637A6A|nr:probable anion transporter 1, chloroplastic isoform X2 [Quercus robur]
MILAFFSLDIPKITASYIGLRKELSNISYGDSTNFLYFAKWVLKLNLIDSWLVCVLPWLTMAFSANFGGWIADTLVSKGLSITMVRKVCYSSFDH